MDKIKYIIAALLLAGCVHILVKSIVISKSNQELKYDLAVLNDAKYGIFNVDEWKVQIQTILFKEISNFQLEGENRDLIKTQLEQLLGTLMVEVEQNFMSQQDGLWNKIKGALVNVVVDFDKLRDQIPTYAEDIMLELEKEENLEAIKSSLQEKLSEWLANAGTEMDHSVQAAILEKHDLVDVKQGSLVLVQEIKSNQKQVWIYTLIGILFTIILWVVLLATEAQKWDNYILVFSCILLLSGGILLPMLDIKAGIESIKFLLMGEEIAFEEQVLFFQSKSILDVVRTLFKSLSFNGIIVGILILLFSIIFPFSKMIASIYYINAHGKTNNRIIRFLVFESSKWSMADVFVVALFMTYLGFSGLIKSQLGAISNTVYVETISFNATSFQPGFTWFLAFCLGGLFFSLALKRLTHAIQH